MTDWFDAEHHVERAHEAYEAGLWDEAEAELRRAIAFNPYQPDWHFNLGLTLEAVGRHAEAALAFEQAVDSGGDEASCSASIGSNLIRDDRAADALPWLDRAIAADGDAPGPHVARVDAYTQLNDYEQAELAFYIGQQAAPDSGELYAAMAEALLARNHHERAIWCLREAARLDPNLPGVQSGLAEAYAATGRTERARQLYIRELRHSPGDIDILLDLGRLLFDMGRLEEASEKVRRVLELEPDQPDAHAALADIAEREGRLDRAIAQLELVRRLDPSFPRVRRRLAGLMLDRLGRPDERVCELLRLEVRSSQRDNATFDDDALGELGELLLDADMHADAVRVFGRLIARRPKDYLARHNLSVALFELGRLSEAQRLARETLELKPGFVPAMYNIAYAHLKTDEWLRARYWVRQATKIAPDDAALRRLRLTLRLRTSRVAFKFFTGALWSVGRFAYGFIGRPRRNRKALAQAQAAAYKRLSLRSA